MTRSGSKVLVAGLITAAAVLSAKAEDGKERTGRQRAASATTTVAQAPATPQPDNRQHQWTCQNLLCKRYVIIGLSF
jgi:hypothetical protein